MTKKLKGFCNLPSQASSYSFTQETKLISQFIERGNGAQLHHLMYELANLHGVELAILLLLGIAERLKSETVVWLKSVFSIELDKEKLEGLYSCESNTVFRRQMDRTLGDMIRLGHTKITGWDEGLTFAVAKKGKKHLATLRGKLKLTPVPIPFS